MAASEADLAHVRRAFVEFNERYESLQDPAELKRYHSEFFAPDSVIEHVDGFPLPGSDVGWEGYQAGFRESYANYRDVHWRIESIEPAGDQVLALLRVSGKPPDDDVRLELALGILYEMRDGRIGHARIYVGHERAREAALSR